jgi:hypothetical protein
MEEVRPPGAVATTAEDPEVPGRAPAPAEALEDRAEVPVDPAEVVVDPATVVVGPVAMAAVPVMAAAHCPHPAG